MFTDSVFLQIILNTLNFLAYLIPMILISSLLFALALEKGEIWQDVTINAELLDCKCLFRRGIFHYFSQTFLP